VGGGALCTFSIVCASLLIVRFEEAASEAALAYDDVPLFPRLDTPGPGPVVLGAQSADAAASSPTTPPKSVTSSDSEVPLQRGEGPGPRGTYYNLSARLVAFTCLSAVLSPAVQLGREHTSISPWLIAIPITVVITLVALVVSMTMAFRPYRALAKKIRQEAGEQKEFRMRLLPLLPLYGIFMNMLLFSQMPLLSVQRMFGQFFFCGLQYLLYGARHSHLRSGNEQ